MKSLVTCPYCLQQHEIEPAKLLGAAKKTPSPAMSAANRERAMKQWAKRRGEK